MRSLKSTVLSLALLPVVSFANTAVELDADAQEAMFAADRTFNNVPLLCYAGFRAVVDLLPEMGNQLNMKMGAKMIELDSDTPNGYNTTFAITMKKFVPKPSVTYYNLQQVYTPGPDTTTGTLYLNFGNVVPAQIDKIWQMLDMGMTACAENLPDKPTIPGIPL